MGTTRKAVSLGRFRLTSDRTLVSADFGTAAVYPAALSSTNLTISQAVVQNPILAVHWKFSYEGRNYTVTFYEDPLVMSGFCDINGGLQGSITRKSGTSFTLNINFNRTLGSELRAYYATFVNGLGEESEPSTPVEVVLDPGKEGVELHVNLTTWGNMLVKANMLEGRYPLHGVRFYRTAASGGNAEFLYAFTVKPASTPVLAGEVYATYKAVDANKFIIYDTIPDTQLGSACSTEGYITDMDEMQNLHGLTSVHNNMLAAFKDNEVWVCEPGKPWAWRRDSVHTMPHKVVAIVPLEQGFYALTDGAPYYFSGGLPEQMQGQRILSGLPCVSKRAWAMVGQKVLYLSPDGPVHLSGLQAEIDENFSRETWQRDVLKDTNDAIACAAWGHRVLCYYPSNPTKQGWLFDAEDKAWTRISQRIDCALPAPAGTFNSSNPSTLIFADGSKQWKLFGSNASTTKLWTWKSKLFVLPMPANMAVIQLFGTGSVKVTVDCKMTDQHTQAQVTKTYVVNNGAAVTLSPEGTLVRLPSGFRSARWQFKIEAQSRNTVLTRIQVASAAKELQTL